jgi:hypothetical protein
MKPNDRRFVICINNEDHQASLEIRKIYIAIDDQEAEIHGLIRIIDESGEDYLYPVDYFAYIELPQAIVNQLAIGG